MTPDFENYKQRALYIRGPAKKKHVFVKDALVHYATGVVTELNGEAPPAPSCEGGCRDVRRLSKRGPRPGSKYEPWGWRCTSCGAIHEGLGPVFT